MLSLSDWGIPASRTEGDEKSEAPPRVTASLPSPTSRRLPSKKTVRMGDEGKAVERRGALAALLFAQCSSACGF
jgi:hypothetical protein